MNNRDFDVVVVGSGVAGLMTTVKLARLGLHVALVEQKDQFSAASSTRNVGWVHSGAYHAGSVQERDEAVTVARHCAFGMQQIRAHYPEVIENYGIASHAVIKNPNNIDEIKSRWFEAGVQVREISLKTAEQQHPGSTIAESAAVFEVGDLSIHTRMFYHRLIAEARLYGVEMVCGARVQRLVSGEYAEALRISLPSSEVITIVAKVFIYATGHGTRQLVKSLTGIDLPVRLWKSQMLLVERISQSNVFHTDLDEVAVIHHRNISIVNLSNDAVPVNRPSYSLNQEGIAKIKAGLLRFLPNWQGAILDVVACIKTDVNEDKARRRSLNVAISEPRENHITVMPGKMTETPYLTDLVCKMVFDRIESNTVAARPMDRFLQKT